MARKIRANRGSKIIENMVQRLADGEEMELAPIASEELRYIEEECKKDPMSAVEKYNEIIKFLEDSPSFCGYADWSNGTMRICRNAPFTPVNGRINGRCKQHFMSGSLNYQDNMINTIKKQDVKIVYLSYQDRFMTVSEKSLYISIMNWFTDNEPDYTPIDLMVLDRGLRSYINAVRKEMEADDFGVPRVAKDDVDFDTKFLRAITTLGLDRKFRLSKKKEDKQNDGDIFDLMGDFSEGDYK